MTAQHGLVQWGNSMPLKLMLAGCLVLLAFIIRKAWLRRAEERRLHQSARLDIGLPADGPEPSAKDDVHRAR
jgi:hypothetical protein